MGTIANINGVTAANISKINGISASGIASVLGQTLSTVPPIPDQSGIVLGCGLFNKLPVSYPEGTAVVGQPGFELTFSPEAPYPVPWQVLADNIAPPYLLETLADQNA